MKKRLPIMLGVLMILGFPFFMEAQEKPDTLQFTLQEAQEYAIQHNLTVQNAALDVDIAQKKVWETTAIGLPQVNGSIDFQRELSEIPELPFGPTDPDTGEPTNVTIREKQNTTYTLTASQLVFSGPYIVGLQASKIYRQLSEQGLQKSELEVKESVTQTYYLILLAEDLQVNIGNNLKNLQKILAETKAMFEAGFTDETDVDQLKVTVTNLENALRSMERQLNAGYNLLKFQMGVGFENAVRLKDDLESIENGFDPDTYTVTTFNLYENIDYKLSETQMKLAHLNYKREITEFLPSLNVFLTYQRLGKQPFINFMPEMLFGAKLSIPIFSSGQRISKVGQRKLEYLKAQNSQKLLAEGLNVEYLQAQFDYNNALEKYLNQKDNVALTEKVLNRTGIKFKEGMTSSLELTQANNQYLQANSEYTTALVELLNAKIRLDKVLNRL